MTARRRVQPAISAAILKACRAQPMTVQELAAEAGTDPKTAQGYVQEWADQGILKPRIGEPRAKAGPRPVEFKLSSQWGGL